MKPQSQARLPRKSISLGRQIIRHRYRYAMLAPAVIVVFLFSYLPLSGLVMAFTEVKFNQSIFQGSWNDFRHFKQFFGNYNTWQLIGNTLFISFLKIVVAFPFPIIFALMINEIRGRYKRVVQTISYLPNFLSWVVVVSIIERIFAPNTGLINQIIRFFGGEGDTFFMMEAKFFYPAVFWSHVWKTIGWESIIYLAAITGINPELYEAAGIDGAGKFQQMRHIILPGIRHIIGLTFILSLGSILSAGFEQIYLFYTPGNMHIANILDTYIIREGLGKARYGYATAIGIIQSAVGLILVVSVNWLSKKVSDVSIY